MRLEHAFAATRRRAFPATALHRVGRLWLRAFSPARRVPKGARCAWSDYAVGRDNNFNLIRFLAALSVLFGHSVGVLGGSVQPRILLRPSRVLAGRDGG